MRSQRARAGAGAAAIRHHHQRTPTTVAVAAPAGGGGSGDGIHRAVLEAGVVRVGAVYALAIGTGVLQSRAARPQARLQRRRTADPAAGVERVGAQLRSRGRAARLADHDADEGAAHARAVAAAQSTGVSAGGDADQAVQRDQRPVRSQRLSHPAGFGRRETDPEKLAALGDERLRCSQEQLIDALTGHPLPLHRQLLGLYLDRYQMIADQIAKLNRMIAEAMQGHQEAVLRLAEVPGFGADSAQQVIAEVGAQASTFPSPANLTSWVGTCPGKQESAEQNHSSRCAKGNRYMRRILNQAAHAAVKKNGSHFQAVSRRLLPRLGYKAAIWAIAHRLCRLVWKILHEGVQFVEQGSEPDPRRKHQRALKLLRILRRLGYEVDIKPAAANLAAATR